MIGPTPNNRPMILDSGFNPFLGPWGDFSTSRHIQSAKLVPAYYAANLRGKTASQKAGIRYERDCVAALARLDFTDSLCSLIANNSYSLSKLHTAPSSETNRKSEIIFQIIHNPNFQYSLRTKFRLCIPDILIVAKTIPANVNYPSTANAANLGAAKNLEIPAKTIVAKNLSLTPAKISGPANFSFPKKQIPAKFSTPANVNPANLLFIIICEVKLTYVDIAFEKLKTLYLPVVAKAFSCPVFPLVIVKNLTNYSPPAKTKVSESLKLQIPLLHYLGLGTIY